MREIIIDVLDVNKGDEKKPVIDLSQHGAGNMHVMAKTGSELVI